MSERLENVFADARLRQPNQAEMQHITASLAAEHLPHPVAADQAALAGTLKSVLASAGRSNAETGAGHSFRAKVIAIRRCTSTFPRPIAWLYSVYLSVIPQVRLIGLPFWLSTTLLMLLGSLLTTTYTLQQYNIVPLYVVAPLLAAWGVAVAFSSYHTSVSSWERSSPITPTQLLAARLSLIVLYDILLGLAGSLLAAGRGLAVPFGLMIGAWLAPLLCLAGLVLVFSVFIDSRVAIGTGMLLWLIFAITTHGGSTLLYLSDKLLAAGVLGAIACIIVCCFVSIRRTQTWSAPNYAD